MKTPIVEFITPEKATDDKKTTEYSDEDLFDISIANVINNASWDISDVLFGTPVTLAHILQKRERYAPFDINPATIVVDEVDLML